MGKAIIGIVSKHFANNESKRTDTYIRDEVKQAVLDNGAIPIGILPTDRKIKKSGDNWKYDLTEEEYTNLVAQIDMCDGIIFQGGQASDNYECIAAKYCYEKDIPTLGICCGQNIIVRAIGGTTLKVANPDKHMRPEDDYVHSIKIDKNSKFYNIVKKDEIMVNSRHKKTVGECPKLNKVAFCEDGYADVVESCDKYFYIGVRFHPESLYTTDENMNNIFKAFITACEEKKNRW